MSETVRRWKHLLFIIAGVIVLDQLSKFAAERYLVVGQGLTIIPGLFDLTLTYNRGAAFGLLADFEDGLRQILLSLATIVALSVVFYLLLVEYADNLVARFALAMIIGGAVGNIIDRARLGMVVDFLDCYIGTYHWPAFNIADSSICIGVAILIFCRSRSQKTGSAASE